VANQGNRAAEHGPKAIQEALYLMQQHKTECSYFDPFVHVDASRLLLLEAELSDLQAESTGLVPRVAKDNARLCELVELLGRRARKLVGAMLRVAVPLVMVVGGGDNYGYDCIREMFVKEGRPVIVVNFDPHVDVRDPVCPTDSEGYASVDTLSGCKFARHSGNWVSQAMSEGMVQTYIPVGLDQLRNNSWTMNYLEHYRVQWEPFKKSLLCTQLKECLEKLVTLIARHDTAIPIYLNFDADSVKGVHVSALNPEGLDPQQAYQCVRSLLSEFGSRIKIVRLAEIGGDPSSSLRHATGLFGANFITTCIAASGVQASSPTGDRPSKKPRNDSYRDLTPE